MAAVTFWSVYILLFVAGGFLTLFGLFPFRPVYAALLPVALIPMVGLVVDRATLLIGVFALSVLLSGLLAGSSVWESLLFLRFAITPYMMYFLVASYVTRRTIKPVLQISLFLGLIQLPVVAFQRLFYDQIMAVAANPVGAIDAYMGTFSVSDDPALSIFLIGLILFLLFDDSNNYFVHHRYFKAAWLTVTVLMANAIITHFMVMGIWGYFAVRHFNLRKLAQLAVVGPLVVVILVQAGYLTRWRNLAVPAISSIALAGPTDQSTFLSGGYSREAGVLYYLSQPLKILGDGPSRYYDPVKRTYILGNTGQVFTMYAEAGLVGLILSYGILWAIASRGRRSSREMRLLYFAALAGVTITTSAMTDASIMLAYALFTTTDLVSANGVKEEKSPRANSDPGPDPTTGPAIGAT